VDYKDSAWSIVHEHVEHVLAPARDTGPSKALCFHVKAGVEELDA
jgi:hypothetical protein